MKEILQKYPRFSRLLDQLCEQSLDQKGADEISRIVKNDPAARDYYIRYLDIHSTLHWDLAISDANPTENKQEQLQNNTRLKQLVESFVAEAALEPINSSLTTGELDTSEFVSSSRPSSSYSSRKTAGTLVAALLLTFMVSGFWALSPAKQHDPVVKQNQPGEVVTSDIATSDELVSNDSSPSPGDKQNSERMAEPDLPPKLPDIKWEQQSNPISTAQADSKKETSEPGSPSAPQLIDDRQIVEVINQRIKQGWIDQSITPSPVADDHEWCRRVYLDLAGRIPTATELSHFLNDERTGRERRLVDRLLESPEFAMSWATRWTNLLVGRSPNKHVDRLALLKYLRHSITENAPWSLVVSDLISAQGDPKKNGPANFLVAHLNNQAVPATAFVARTLLGTQIQCAQCHRHPFYETTQRQFWELNSFFKQAKVVAAPQMTTDANQQQTAYLLTDQPVGGPTYYETRSGLMQVAYPRFNGHKVSDDKTVIRRQELAKLLVEGDDPLIAQSFVNRTWSHFFGYGFTLPIDDIGPHNPPSHPKLFETLSRSFVASGYDIKRLVRWICLSRPYRLSSHPLPENRQDTPQWGDPPAFSHMYFKPLSPEQLYNSLVEISGNYPHSSDDWNRHLENRESWVLQFVESLDNDENGESNHFQGTITQALMMMNGELINRTISPDSSRFTASLIGHTGSDLKKFETVCLAILSREPKPGEIVLFRKMIHQLKGLNNPVERRRLLAGQLEDVMWAYLNSSEFIINH